MTHLRWNIFLSRPFSFFENAILKEEEIGTGQYDHTDKTDKTRDQPVVLIHPEFPEEIPEIVDPPPGRNVG